MLSSEGPRIVDDGWLGELDKGFVYGELGLWAVCGGSRIGVGAGVDWIGIGRSEDTRLDRFSRGGVTRLRRGSHGCQADTVVLTSTNG